ncbi:MAG: hypothetical protein N2112_06175 [Gemmataceae bacterium]|nr:hypothetical protein [Gemmataceae bacterium]
MPLDRERTGPRSAEGEPETAASHHPYREKLGALGSTAEQRLRFCDDSYRRSFGLKGRLALQGKSRTFGGNARKATDYSFCVVLQKSQQPLTNEPERD